MGRADQLPLTTTMRPVALTEVAFVLTTIGIVVSRPHPAYAYVVAGLLGLALQTLVIVTVVRVLRRRRLA